MGLTYLIRYIYVHTTLVHRTIWCHYNLSLISGFYIFWCFWFLTNFICGMNFAVDFFTVVPIANDLTIDDCNCMSPNSNKVIACWVFLNEFFYLIWYLNFNSLGNVFLFGVTPFLLFGFFSSG